MAGPRPVVHDEIAPWGRYVAFRANPDDVPHRLTPDDDLSEVTSDLRNVGPLVIPIWLLRPRALEAPSRRRSLRTKSAGGVAIRRDGSFIDVRQASGRCQETLHKKERELEMVGELRNRIIHGDVGIDHTAVQARAISERVGTSLLNEANQGAHPCDSFA